MPGDVKSQLALNLSAEKKQLIHHLHEEQQKHPQVIPELQVINSMITLWLWPMRWVCGLQALPQCGSAKVRPCSANITRRMPGILRSAEKFQTTDAIVLISGIKRLWQNCFHKENSLCLLQMFQTPLSLQLHQYDLHWWQISDSFHFSRHICRPLLLLQLKNQPTGSATPSLPTVRAGNTHQTPTAKTAVRGDSQHGSMHIHPPESCDSRV